MPKRKKFKNVEISSCEFIIKADTASSRRVRRKKKRDRDKGEERMCRDTYVTKSLSSDTGFSEPSQAGDSPIFLTDSIEEAVRWEISKLVEERRRTQEPMLDVQLPSFVEDNLPTDKETFKKDSMEYSTKVTHQNEKEVNIWEQLDLIDLEKLSVETVKSGDGRVESKTFLI